MSKYYEQLQKIFHQYEHEEGYIPTAKEAVAWGVKKRLLTVPDIDPLDRLAEDMANALREETHVDRFGRRYRVNHAVRVTSGGVQHTLWGGMDVSPRPFMEKAFAQRRKGIVGDCVRLKTDVDVYNDKNTEQEPINLVLDFTKDVEEEGFRGAA